MRISDWSSDVCSSDLVAAGKAQRRGHGLERTPALLPPVVERRVRQQDVAQGALDLVGLLPVGAEHRGRTVDQLLARAVRAEATDQLLADEFGHRSEEHTSELQSLMRISYAVFCLKKKTKLKQRNTQ